MLYLFLKISFLNVENDKHKCPEISNNGLMEAEKQKHSGASKLTEDDVRDIRKQIAYGTRKAEIAEQYGVSYFTIAQLS